MNGDLVHIKSLNKKGWGIGSSEKGSIEIPGVLPSEQVEVELGRSRRGKRRGRLAEGRYRSQRLAYYASSIQIQNYFKICGKARGDGSLLV